MPIKLSQNQILNWGGAAVYREAEALVKRGGVLRADMDDPWLEGVVARSSGAHLATKLKINADGTVESHCPCYINREQNLICAHVVALAILVMQRRTDPLREQKYQEEQRHARATAARAAATPVRRNPRGTPAKLLIFLPRDWVAAFARDAVELGCVFQVGPQLLPSAALTDSGGYALSPADDALLSVLEDICEGTPPAGVTVNKPDFFNILELSRNRALPVTDNTDVRIRDTPLDFALRLDLDRETGELLIFPETAIPGASPTTFPTYLACNKKSWALANGSLWPLKQTLPLPYHGLYWDSEPVAIPRTDVLRFIQNELPQLMRDIPVICEIALDLFTTSCAQPVFHLAVRGSPASVAVELKAVYGATAFAAAGPDTAGSFTIPDPDDLLHFWGRNPDRELQAIRHLNTLGFAGEQGDRFAPIIGTRAVLNFLGSDLPALRRMGWKVTTEGRVAEFYETMPVVTPVVRVETPSGANWFEVGLDYECAGVPALTPADIQRALNRRESFIEREGQSVLIDRSAIESMRDVFSDCRARDGVRPGTFRLPTVYAPFVQSSLAAIDGIDVEEPPDWRAVARQQNRDLTLTPVPLGDDTLERTLRDYQKQGVYWLRFLEASGFSGLLADEMGLGKTLQTLVWLSLERAAADARGKPALIVCPTSLVENWNREAERFVPRLRRLVLNGSARHTLFEQIPRHDLVITSYALLRRDLETCYAGHTFSVAILDEAQHIKNRSTQNAVAAKQIRAASRLVLTGTPVENSVADLWSIMDFLMPGYLGEYDSFHAHYEGPIGAGGESGAQAQIKLRRKLHPFLLRRLKRDVAKDLPDKIEKVSYCILSPDQQQVYNTLLQESRRKIGDLVREKGFGSCRMEILAMLLRLRQVCCHLGLLKSEELMSKAEAPSAKLDQFFELLDEALDGGHRILVFSQFVSMLKIIREALDARGLAYCYLDGQTHDRIEQVHRFNQTPGIPLFLISLKAGGTGLNLTGADMVVHFDPWWNPAVEDQATDRAHRIGQKKTVYSIKLIAEHTIEEKVLALQKKKQAVIQATVGTTDDAFLSTLSWDDVQSLLET
jgi:superfamily II DNA or RNA helicase